MMLSIRSGPKQRKPAAERSRAQLRVEALEARINLAPVGDYYGEWFTYPQRNYQVRDFPGGRADLLYAFANPSNAMGDVTLFDRYAAIDKFFPGDSFDQPILGNFNQIRLLKERFPNMRATLSIGGWTLSTYFSDIAATPQSRQHFGESLRDFMLRYAPAPLGGSRVQIWDEVDLDWEYPVAGGLSTTHTRPEDGQNFVLLLQELRRQLDVYGQQDGRYYSLTAALPAGDDKIQNLVLPDTARYLDKLRLLTFDFHGSTFSPKEAAQTNHNAPIFFSPDDPSPQANTYFTASAVQQYLDGGVPPEKLSIGMPLYSRCWRNVDAANNGMYQHAQGPCSGEFGEAGVLDLKNIDSRVQQQPGTYPVFRDVTGEPWVYARTVEGGALFTYADQQFVDDVIAFGQSNGINDVWFWAASGDVPGPRSLVTEAANRLGGPGAAPSRSSLKGKAAALLLETRTLVSSPAATFEITLGPSLTTAAEMPPVAETQSGLAKTDALTTSRVTALPHHQQAFDQALASVVHEFELFGG